MLISCPKCHSIYEIPDDLIPRTGQNFRCQACANVWHALREDAIGYQPEEERDDKPYIEAITVNEPSLRSYPANKQTFTIPADSKSGRKTRSSKDILSQESDPDYIAPAPQTTVKKELTLTSDLGTAFTISTDAEYDSQDDRPTPRLFSDDNELSADANNRLLPEKTFKGFKKTYLMLFLLSLVAIMFFLRREIVAMYPEAETYYNTINLSGLSNVDYLKFTNITVEETSIEDRPILKITADIYNDSFYQTVVPEITLSGIKETFSPKRRLLKGYEKTTVELTTPIKESSAQHLTLSFKN